MEIGEECNECDNNIWIKFKLEQLERLRFDNTPPPQVYSFYWVTLDPKAKVTNSKNLPKFKFLNFETNFTRDTPSEVAWQDV